MRALAVVFLLGLAPLLAAQAPKEKTDQERLQGEWVLVGLDVREELVPAAKLAGTTLVVRGDTYATVVKKKEYPTTFKLDPKQDPKHIDMLVPDESGTPRLAKGIYKIDGDKFVVCRGQAPGGERPRDFVSSATNDVFVVTWERKAKP
ncbi:MAG TPA: TIGR03067 domain-containing protein [Urbifossiella sp.]|nr:TIGR03067 domain-containing protein [Urbifossiella sp.]